MKARLAGLVGCSKVASSVAAAHRAAAAVEQAQLNVVRVRELIEQADQRDLGAVELPVAGENAAVLVAVAVAEHDVLLSTRALHQPGHPGQRIELAHDARGIAQVVDGLKQRHHDQVGHRRTIECAAQQRHLLLQQQHFEQIANRLGVADDVVADGRLAVAAAHEPGGLEDGQLALRVGAVLGGGHAQHPRIVEQAQ
jgi:hypothetical protein